MAGPSGSPARASHVERDPESGPADIRKNGSAPAAGRPTPFRPVRRRRLLTCLGPPVLLALCLLLAGVGYVLYALNRPLPTIPSVVFTYPESHSQMVTDELSAVFARAEDPDGIARVGV